MKKIFISCLTKMYLRNCYQSIDEMPIFNWNKIHDGGSLSFLRRTKNVHLSKKKVNKFQFYFLNILWRKLKEEHIEKFGFSDDFLSICRKKKEIIILRTQRVINDDKSLNAFIQIAETELEQMQKEGSVGNFWELKGALDRAGFNVIPTETSVTEFYTHIQTLVKQSKVSKAQ